MPVHMAAAQEKALEKEISKNFGMALISRSLLACHQPPLASELIQSAGLLQRLFSLRREMRTWEPVVPRVQVLSLCFVALLPVLPWHLLILLPTLDLR